ncbi:LysR family transcriptional regulator [Gallaecimonas mangrovi]|uniref:LysR family transcriptional regulator n=1 Tax=Gallaecimonas mangrovi TaxID=2291597 RepID=UPI000E201B19|nr:LysR family transcriptional regulator [Gallaecimonas mangrovi]
MDKNLSWEWYRSFLAVMQHGSLSAAARELGSTQPTLGRHITALERQLGKVLFTRAQGGLIASQEAKALLPFAEQMASSAKALHRLASSQGSHIEGVVRITASDIVGVELLPPILAKLSNRYPALQLELDLSDKAQDLLHRQADIAVRMFRPTQQQLIARKVGMLALGLYASPAYLAHKTLPTAMADLTSHGLIGFDHTSAFIRDASKQLAVSEFERRRFALATDSNVAQLAMIKAGLGIGFCQDVIAKRYALCPVLPEIRLNLEAWLVMHEDLKHSKACQAVFSALAEGMVTL